MNDSDTCERCRFWRRIEEKDFRGECLRHAPRPLVIPEQFADGKKIHLNRTFWPLTGEHDGCGQFEKKAR